MIIVSLSLIKFAFSTKQRWLILFVHDSQVFLVCWTKRKSDFMITTFQPWWYRQMFSCDNWILFFWRHEGNNRSSNLIFCVLNACCWFYLHSVCKFLRPKDEGLLVLNGFVKFTFRWLDRVYNIVMTSSKNWSSDWLKYFWIIFAVAIIWRHSAHCEPWLPPGLLSISTITLRTREGMELTEGGWN